MNPKSQALDPKERKEKTRKEKTRKREDKERDPDREDKKRDPSHVAKEEMGGEATWYPGGGGGSESVQGEGGEGRGAAPAHFDAGRYQDHAKRMGADERIMPNDLS